MIFYVLTYLFFPLNNDLFTHNEHLLVYHEIILVVPNAFSFYFSKCLQHKHITSKIY